MARQVTLKTPCPMCGLTLTVEQRFESGIASDEGVWVPTSVPICERGHQYETSIGDPETV